MKNSTTKKPLLTVISFSLILALAALLCGCSCNSSNDTASTDTSPGEVPEGFRATCYADIDIENYGKITVGLDANSAPITVDNFVKLAKDGFYNGLMFHRIIKDFMIQGGDPNGNGTGGSGQNIKGEFTNNGVANNLKHTRGAISMARSSTPNSASSQFFIVHQTSSNNTKSLDGKYACFGYVTSGMGVVDKICEKVKPTDSNGTVKKNDQPKIKSITIKDN